MATQQQQMVKVEHLEKQFTAVCAEKGRLCQEGQRHVEAGDRLSKLQALLQRHEQLSIEQDRIYKNLNVHVLSPNTLAAINNQYQQSEQQNEHAYKMILDYVSKPVQVKPPTDSVTTGQQPGSSGYITQSPGIVAPHERQTHTGTDAHQEGAHGGTPTTGKDELGDTFTTTKNDITGSEVSKSSSARRRREIEHKQQELQRQEEEELRIRNIEHNLELARIKENNRRQQAELRLEQLRLEEDDDDLGRRSPFEDTEKVPSWLDSQQHKNDMHIGFSCPVDRRPVTGDAYTPKNFVYSSDQINEPLRKDPAYTYNNNRGKNANVLGGHEHGAAPAGAPIRTSTPVAEVDLRHNNENLGHNVNSYSNNISKSLPKWKLAVFSGDVIEWPEWQGMFLATVDAANISHAEKMSHLKTLLGGKAKQTISGMGYAGDMYPIAWQALTRKFGQPHLIVSSQLARLNKIAVLRNYDSQAIIEFGVLVNQLVNVLTAQGYLSDLRSAANLKTVVNKLPPDIKNKWYTHLTTVLVAVRQPGLVEFNEFLTIQVEVHERLLSSNPNVVPPNFNNNKKYGSSFAATSNPPSYNKDYVSKSFKCPMNCETDHKIVFCTKFKALKVPDRYNKVKELRLCFNCLNGGHSIKNCRQNKICNVDGCQRRHHALIHQTPSEAPKTTTSNLTTENRGGLLQVLPVRIHGPTKWRDTYAILDTGSTNSWISQELVTDLKIIGEDTQLSVNGINGIQQIESSTVNLKVGTTSPNFQAQEINAYVHPKLQVGIERVDIDYLKAKYEHLKPV